MGAGVCWASEVVLLVENMPANTGVVRDTVLSLGQKDPLEEGMATYSSILAWRISWMEEPGGLQTMRSRRVGHDWRNLAHIGVFYLA